MHGGSNSINDLKAQRLLRYTTWIDVKKLCISLMEWIFHNTLRFISLKKINRWALMATDFFNW